MPGWEQLATDHFDPWQLSSQTGIYTLSRLRLVISTAFVVASCVGCLWVTRVYIHVPDYDETAGLLKKKQMLLN